MYTAVMLVSLAAMQFNDASSCLDASLKSRRVLSSDYHLVIGREITTPKLKKSNDTDDRSNSFLVDARIEIWSSASKFRCDYVVLQMTERPTSVGQKMIQCKDCERIGYTLLSGKTTEKSKLLGVSFEKNEQRTVNDFIFDWRNIGFLNNSMSAYHRVPYTFSLDEMRKNSSDTIEHDVRNGANCVVLSSRLNKAGLNSHKIWLDTDKYHSPHYFELSRGIHTTTTEIQYVFYPNIKVWFPKLIRFITTRDGKENYRETLTIQQADLNKPVPEKVFTFAGLDLIEGHPVDVPEITDPTKQPTWRNGKLDFEYTATKQSADAYAKLAQQSEKNQSPLAQHTGPPVPDTPPPSDRWMYYAGAGILVVVSGVLLLVARKSRKS